MIKVPARAARWTHQNCQRLLAERFEAAANRAVAQCAASRAEWPNAHMAHSRWSAAADEPIPAVVFRGLSSPSLLVQELERTRGLGGADIFKPAQIGFGRCNNNCVRAEHATLQYKPGPVQFGNPLDLSKTFFFLSI